MRLVDGLHLDDLRGDICGGLTAAAVALPLALAFGFASGAGPAAGLYGAIFQSSSRRCSAARRHRYRVPPAR